MRFAVCLPSLLLVAVAIAAPLQSHAQPVSLEVEEIRRLAGQIEDLRAALEAQQRKTTSLQREVDSLRTALRQSTDKTETKMSEFVTRDALKGLANAIKEVDEKRIADRKLIIQEVQQSIDSLATTVQKPKPEPPPTQAFDGKAYPHTVQRGEYLSTILDAYNAEFKRQGKGTVTLDDVKRANPTININRIYVGQKIFIPDPSATK